MRITSLNRGSVADNSSSIESMFYIDNNGAYQLGRHSSVNDIKELLGTGFFQSDSDDLTSLKAAFDYAKDIYPSGFGGGKSISVIEKLLTAGHSPFVKIKLGVLNKDALSYLPSFSEDRIERMLPILQKLIAAGAPDIKINECFVYTTVNNENFESLFGIPVPAGSDMPFSIQHLTTISEFLCNEFQQERLSFTALTVLNEFRSALSEVAVNTMFSLIPDEEVAIIKAGFDKLPSALERAEKNKLYDLLIDLSENVRSTGNLIGAYRNIFSPEQFNAVAEKHFAFPMNYHSASSFADVVETISNGPTALIYTRKLYSYLFSMLTTGTYSIPVGFLGVITSLNTNYLSNLIPAEFLATMVSEITKQRDSIPSNKSLKAAQYILLILDALNAEGEYDLMYSRVATCASMAMAAIREEEVTGIYDALRVEPAAPFTLLNGTSYIDRIDANGLLARIHQKIYHARDFEVFMRTLDVTTPNVTAHSDEYIEKMRSTKEFLSQLSVIGDKHLSPVSAVLKYGDITPETILRLQRNFIAKPTLLATFMEETLLFMKQDTILAHPVYKYICDFNLLRDVNARYFTDFDFTVMAGSLHFFLHVPELWTLVMLHWFATPATYDYLAIPKEQIDRFVTEGLATITNDVSLMGNEIFGAPLMDVASYLDPVVSFYKAKYNVWEPDNTMPSLEPLVMAAVSDEPDRGSLPPANAEPGDVQRNDTSSDSESS